MKKAKPWDFIKNKSVDYFSSQAYQWPLIENNISTDDKVSLSKFILKTDKFTQGPEVANFEREWSSWLGVKYSVFVNSGSAANFLSLSTLRDMVGVGEVIVPPLTWISDIVSVLENGFTPVFVDISAQHLGMNEKSILKAISSKTKAVFLTHVLGFNALSNSLLAELKKRKILLIEDCCESHGATLGSKKLGTFGAISNFSFYYGHHMTTIEGGMVSTNEPRIYELLRMKRAHGLLRESPFANQTQSQFQINSSTWPEFTFPVVGFNFRSTEINAHLGRLQLKRLSKNIAKRNSNFEFFLKGLPKEIFFTDFKMAGSSNYALILILNPKFSHLTSQLKEIFAKLKIEYRRGLSGGGNQLRQPMLKTRDFVLSPQSLPVAEWVHQSGFYIGNFPTLKKAKIRELLNELKSIN